MNTQEQAIVDGVAALRAENDRLRVTNIELTEQLVDLMRDLADARRILCCGTRPLSLQAQASTQECVNGNG